MNSTGVEELVGASFGGLTSIFNGKAWPKAMRTFRMVVSALLHDFLVDGEKTHEQITAFLEKARAPHRPAMGGLLHHPKPNSSQVLASRKRG